MEFSSNWSEIVNERQKKSNNESHRVVIKRALISVFDKTGLSDLVQFLVESGVIVTATGGTGDHLRARGLPIEGLDTISKFRELIGGRVKSLHPAVHAAILANRDDESHVQDLHQLGIEPFDLVVGHLYPFESISKGRLSADAIEAIDIGGPAMLRAAAKNHQWVTALMEPTDYPHLKDEMRSSKDGSVSQNFRRQLAARVYARTAEYDASIATVLAGHKDHFPKQKILSLQRVQRLRYGENPHQSAAFYTVIPSAGKNFTQQLSGAELGFNNITDADAALSLVSEFNPDKEAACAIIKHGTPCGAARHSSLKQAFVRARGTDPLSAFGGVISLNREVDLDTAECIAKEFYEILIAPGFQSDAVEVLSYQSRLRLIEVSLPEGQLNRLQWRSVNDGFVVQECDAKDDTSKWTGVSRIKPSDEQWHDLEFAWKLAKHARSNAVAVAANGQAIGIASGRTSRVDAAAAAAKPLDKWFDTNPDISPVAASDGFFPFVDGVEALAASGVTAIAQPGGSRRDSEVIATCDRLGIAMVFTHQRQFRH